MTILEFDASGKFLEDSRKYDPSRPYPPPVTDAEEAARVEFLKAENEHLKKSIAAYKKTAQAHIEQQATDYAEALMRQMGLKK